VRADSRAVRRVQFPNKTVVNILLKPQERGPSTTVISIKAQLREIAMIRGSL
jgi:hypothetical protein